MQERVANVDGREQIIGKALAGEIFGEMGVLCRRPQPFTFRTTEISQLLRLKTSALMNILKANAQDEHKIMHNLFQVKITSILYILSFHFLKKKNMILLSDHHHHTCFLHTETQRIRKVGSRLDIH